MSQYRVVALKMLLLVVARTGTATTVEQHSQYRACMAAPATCTALRMGNAQVTGTIPSEITAFTRLLQIHLYANRLTGTIPTELGMLTTLTYMSFAGNQLTGTVPSELGALTRIEQWGLERNELTSTIPTELAALTRLTIMYMCNNTDLCGDIPAGVTPDYHYQHCPQGALADTNLGYPCPSTAPSASPSWSPTDAVGSAAPTGSPARTYMCIPSSKCECVPLHHF
mmetsp:Transcript_35936/g.68916  ORF Transcript_35936/g.68916 Transcript_35936/m.68916 type:complete len:226 (+) Transcript_35936:86-763(+)